jgi:hypothetical protein
MIDFVSDAVHEFRHRLAILVVPRASHVLEPIGRTLEHVLDPFQGTKED